MPAKHDKKRATQDYFLLVLKRKWLIIGCVFLVVFPGFLYVMYTKPVYQASANLLIESENPQVVDVQEVVNIDPRARDYLQTQLRVLESRSIARDVIQSLHLDQHPDFAPKEPSNRFPRVALDAFAAIIDEVKGRVEAPAKTNTPEQVVDPLTPFINRYLSRLIIEPLRASRMVGVSFQSHDPVLAAKVANEHAETYIRKYRELKTSSSQDAIGWLAERLEEARKKLRSSEEMLQRFQERENVVVSSSSSQAGGEGREDIVSQKLADINSALTSARTQRISLETLLRQVRQVSKRPEMVGAIPQVLDNPFIQGLKQQYVDLNRQYLELRQKYGDLYPRIVTIRNDIREVEKRIATEAKKIAKSIEIKYRVALAEERGLQAALEKAKKEAIENNKKIVHFNMLQQEVDSNRQIYEMLLKRSKETLLTTGLNTTNLFLVDRAEVPQAPIKPSKSMILLLASIVGLGLGLGLTFFMDHLDQTFHGPDELKRFLDVPFLGPVGAGSTDKQGKKSMELAVIHRPRSRFAECIRNIRTNILCSLAERQQKVVLITSPNPAEGKSVVASNLAASTAQMGKRVLLVDADMRLPRLHEIFGLTSSPGLSNLLIHKCSLRRAVKRTKVKGLTLMPAGVNSSNPSEALASGSLARFLEQIKEQFDYIFIDTPPVLAAADASILGNVADGIVLVIEASKTKWPHARRALEHLNDVGAQVMGAVLNRVDFGKERYYYTYYASYYQYYADEGGKHRKKRSKA